MAPSHLPPRPPPSAPSGPRIPPTGPKALRVKQPPSGPAGGLNPRHEKVSFAFPSSSSTAPGENGINSQTAIAGPSRPRPNGLDNRSSSLTSSSSASTLNGPSKSNGTGESSIHASSPAASSPFRINIPSGPSPNRKPPTLNQFPSSTSIASSSSHSINEQPKKPPTSPKKRHHKSLAGAQHKSEEDNSYRSSFLPTDESARAKVSISFAGVGLTNGIMKRPRPPHMDFEKSSPAGTPPPPPPPDGRPPTPPLPPGSGPPSPPPIPDQDERIPTPPPEDDDMIPPPPPSPPTQAPPLPPPSPKPPSAPRSFFSSPSSSRIRSSSSISIPIPPPPSIKDRPPSPPPIEPSSPPPPAPPSPGPMPPAAPPSFHFRDLSIRQKSPSEEEDEEGDTNLEPLEPASPPPAPPKSPTPPYIPPSYVPPACVYPRPGIGSFATIKGKQRFDGIEEGQAVEASDPRLKISKEQLNKGRGTRKCRTTFYEVDYEWDEYSTGPKPPPPPAAVLITGLSPLTTTDQISKFLRPHGRIKDIDAKMDTKSGMQLGICWVKFDGPPHGRQGTAHDVACQVVRICDGQRISLNADEKIKVVLDGRGLRTQQAVKDEMLKRYPPKPKVIPKPAVPVSTPSLIPPTAGTSTPSSAGAQTPRAESSFSRVIPSVPKPLTGSLPSRPYMRPPPTQPANFHASLPSRPGSLPSRPLPPHSTMFLPSRPSGLPARPDTSVQHLASSFTAAPFSRPEASTSKRYDQSDSYTPGQRLARSSSRTPYSDYTSDYTSDSEDDHARPAYRSRERSPVGRRRVNGRVAPQPNKEDEKATERMKDALLKNGMSHVFIDSKALPLQLMYENYLRDHFKAFKPSQILHNHSGWYILFSDNNSAYRAQRVLDTTAIQGHRLTLVVKAPPSAATKKSGEEDKDKPVAMGEANVEKGTWKFLTITKKNRPAPTGPKADRVKESQKIRSRMIESDESSDEDTPTTKPKKRVPSFSSASSLSDDEALAPLKAAKSAVEEDEMAMDIDEEPMSKPSAPVLPDIAQEKEQETDDTPIPKGKKRPAKAKVTKKNKKARLDSPVPTIDEPVVEILPPPEPEVAEITIDEKPEATAETTKPAKKAVAAKRKGPKSDFEKFIASSIIDEEDAYWLGRALEAAKEGVEPTFPEDVKDEEVLLDKDHPLYHTSGSWRAEGYKKVPPASKSSYLPQRNKATTAAVEDSMGITTGRTARLAGRDQNRQTQSSSITTDSELFAFNQLRIRKKQLRFARSAIEGYGLYAMETIHQGEMVCEYVGELCRAAIADVREQKYLKQGIGSSYLFRIDNDVVCDATFRGSVSRLINHSCDPSANAKIIKVNGQSKIVIYAERTLYPGEEILYDYKFPLESDPALRVPCLCGAATCRGWLN